jgi:hypothetical protein
MSGRLLCERLKCDQTATVFVEADLEFRCDDHAEEEELEDDPAFYAILASTGEEVKL